MESASFLVGIAFSTHLGLTNEYNEIHPHVKLQSSEYVIGAYHNSVDRLGLYAGKRFKAEEKISYEAGLVVGYEVAVLPYVKVNYHINENINLFMGPTFDTNKDNETEYGVVAGIELFF